ncbi:TetR/AcrR family transcriptional regulator [Flavitalea sp.]|nr:TetR/AcrR family transcriptional regulator [Flavitalea sp.]
MAKVIQKDKSTEEKILAAAKNVFIRQGMMGARMQDIADEAGINKALLHYYFRNKEQLFDVIFMQAAGQLFPRIRMIFESDVPLFEMIERFCEDYIEIISANTYLPLFVFNEINRDPAGFMKKINGAMGFPKPELFLQKIEKEIKKGTIKKISPLQLLLNLLSMCIFPFVAKPLLLVNLQLDEMQFRAIMDQRKKDVARFIIDSIKK